MLATLGTAVKRSLSQHILVIGASTRARLNLNASITKISCGRMSSTSANPNVASPPKQSLPPLGEDMLTRKAMVLQEEQMQRYFPHLEARGWSLKPGEPSATFEKRFDFGTEDELARWTGEMLTCMQRAKHHAQLKIMYKSVDVQTNTHRAYTPQEPKMARPGLSNKDIQLAYHAEVSFEDGHAEAKKP